MKSFPVHITSGRILLLKNSEPDIKRLQLRCFEFAGFTWISSKKGFTLLGSFYLTTAFVAFLNKLNKPWKHPFEKIFVPWLALEIMVQINVVCQVITFRRCTFVWIYDAITILSWKIEIYIFKSPNLAYMMYIYISSERQKINKHV